MSEPQMSDLISIGATVKLLVDALAKAFPTRVKDGTTILLVVGLAFGLAGCIVFLYAFREVIYAGMIILAAALGIDVSRHWGKVQRVADVLDVEPPQRPERHERTPEVPAPRTGPPGASYGSSDVTRGTP
jgi:hypothetical protein